MNCSLLIPCHNAAAFLPRLMETVRAQSLRFAEIVCYDDASTDDTVAIARQQGATVIVGATNQGSAFARNELWRAATCDWVHFHDADDLLHPDFLRRMVERASADIDVVICNAEWRFEDSRQLEMRWQYSEAELRPQPVNYLLGHPVGGINGLYRRSSLERVGGFDPGLKVWEDADLHVRLAAAGARFAVVEEFLVTALRRKDSVSAPLLSNWQNRLVALKNYRGTLPVDCRPTLIAEFETAARSLLRYGDVGGAREAVAIARSLGGDIPRTNNPLVHACKRTFGPIAALRLQAAARRC